MPDIFDALGNQRKIALRGEMGAGKTTFAKIFCAFLGVETVVTSPSFSLVNEYLISKNKNPALNGLLVRHLDLYRLKNVNEAFDIGLEDFLYDENFALIEWAEIIEPFYKGHLSRIEIEILDENQRRITVHAPFSDHQL